MSSSVTSSSNSGNSSSNSNSQQSNSGSSNRFKNYSQTNSQNQKQRYNQQQTQQPIQNTKHKNYAQAAQSNPTQSGLSYASAAAAVKSQQQQQQQQQQQTQNQIENASNLAKMDHKLSKMNKSQLSEGVYRNSKFVMASNSIIGCPVILKVKSNDTFHGIFVTYSPEYDVLLECCHKIDPDNEVVIFGRSLPRRSQVNARFFERENIVEMTAIEVDKDFAMKTAENNFIDAAIAAKVTTKPSNSPDDDQCKELEPFPFDDEEHSASSSNNLELDNNSEQMNQAEMELTSSNSGWNAEDMLMTNQQKYGYKSTYNSDLSEYTIPVEKEDTEEFRRREVEAEKLANEIESSATYRRNIDKELSDNEEEEEAFSAVVRTEINNNSSTNNNNVKESYQKNDKYQRRSYNQNSNKNPNTNQRQPLQQQRDNNKRQYNQTKQIDRQSSTSSNNSYKRSQEKTDTKKYPQKYQQTPNPQPPQQQQHNLSRQSSGTNSALFSSIVANTSQDQSFSSQVSYSSKVSQSSKKEKNSPSPQVEKEISSTSSSASNTPNKSLNTSQPVIESVLIEQQPQQTNESVMNTDEAKFKLNPNAIEFNPTFIQPSQNSPSPGLMTNQPIQIVVAPVPGQQYNYEQYQPVHYPGQPPIIYQQPGLVTPQQTTQILINNPGPIPQFYVMNQPAPQSAGQKVKKAVVSVNEGASIAITQRGNPIYYGPNGQQIIPQPYAAYAPNNPPSYAPVRMMAPNAPQYYPMEQQPQGQPVYYPYPNQIVHPPIPYNQQYIMSPQIPGQGQQQAQQQPPPSSTPSNVQNNHSAPHTPSPMPNINQTTQQLQQMQINYPPQAYGNFIPPQPVAYPQGVPPPPPQGYGYQIPAYQPGQPQSSQFMYVQNQSLYQQNQQQPPQQQQQQPGQQQNYPTYHHQQQNRAAYYTMSSSSSTNLQNQQNGTNH
ncbi:unnamed protein product [Brachionus calyciflorus]|uniref:LsmAD domain-containing protein n=1 Tax=Brachionus calyciflorus TaxID=104777 RepID=A0A813RCR3_9BILA|nr:unnamed protein product [Brachionus calyciflorus]